MKAFSATAIIATIWVYSISMVQAENWTPANITTKAWYDASDNSSVTTSNSSVTSWAGKSGTGYDLVQISTKFQPTYSATGWDGSSLPAIAFDGTGNYLEYGTALDLANGLIPKRE